MNKKEILEGVEMKLLNVYRYGCLSLFKLVVLILLQLTLLILLLITIPLWWLKHIQNLLSNFGVLIEEVTNW